MGPGRPANPINPNRTVRKNSGWFGFYNYKPEEIGLGIGFGHLEPEHAQPKAKTYFCLQNATLLHLDQQNLRLVTRVDIIDVTFTSHHALRLSYPTISLFLPKNISNQPSFTSLS